MSITREALKFSSPGGTGFDGSKNLLWETNGIFSVSNSYTLYYKTDVNKVSQQQNFFVVTKLQLSSNTVRTTKHIYQLYPKNNGTNNISAYYKIGSGNFNSFVDNALQGVESSYYNKICIDYINKEKQYIYVYERGNKSGNGQWYQITKTKKGSKAIALAQLKVTAGSTENKGNGFFYQAGVFEKGRRDTTSSRYFVINWSESAVSPGQIVAIGTGGDVYTAITQKMQKENNSSNTSAQYILLQVKDNDYGYEILCGGFANNDQRSLSQIQSYLTDEDNGVDLSVSSPDAGSWTGGGDSGGSSGYHSTAKPNPITGIIKESVAQIEYIKDFPNYVLSFQPGLDKRSVITDPFEKSSDKITSLDSFSTDKNNLILKINISDKQLNSASTEMTVSDQYYLYTEVDSDSNISKSKFFGELDEILNIDYFNKFDFWEENRPPFGKNKWALLPQTVCIVNTNDKSFEKINSTDREEVTVENFKGCKKVTLKWFFDMEYEERKNYKMFFFDVINENGKIVTKLSTNTSFSQFLENINPYIKLYKLKTYSANFIFQQNRKPINLYSLELLEAYTRGHDFIQENYTTVRAKETLNNNQKVMNFNDNYFAYKYSGRNFDIMRKRNENDIFTFSNGVPAALVHECDLLMESDVTLGDSYGQRKYFIEYIKYKDTNNGNTLYKDTFKVKDYTKAVDPTKYIEEDLDIVTSTIDLTQCKYYNPTVATYENHWSDCKFGTGDKYEKECVYQKLGYCPYRFKTEKHPRRIRTLSQEKSNRFNLVQELSQVFKIYPQFYIEFDRNGKVLLDEQGRMKKHIFFMTEKGNVNRLGFRYEKNLSDISRTVDSTSLTTKLFVENIDSELSRNGVCSIQTAEDNISKTSYLIDFSYYTKMNILDKEKVVRDLYGVNKGDFAFLPTIGYYNDKYDKLTNLIINLTGETMVKLEAENETYTQGVMTALEERQKICQRMYQFKIKSYQKDNYDYTTSDSYKNYLEKMKEQSTILWGQIEKLFFTNNFCTLIFKDTKGSYFFNSIEMQKVSKADNQYMVMINKYKDIYCNGELFWRLFIEGFDEEKEYKPLFNSWIDFKEKIIDTKLYPINGTIGQYNGMFNQVKKWKTERAKWLNKINDISEQFYKKYEPFIKEGTWTDSNFLTDNEYYWAATNVLSDSSQPKITYTLKVINLSPLDKDYVFELADTSFVEDIDFFGINQKTGLPNQQKVLISGLEYNLDNPIEDSIEVKNYTSSFDELFESISASVQSLTFNENIYKRASNFTATKYISKDALQGTLFDGDLTLVDTYSEDIVMDDTGIQGKNIANSALGYKLDGEGLAFTKDNGQTYDVGVGPNGINADYITFGQLDASKIQIVSGNYIYFLWDKDGINAYRNPATSTSGLVDFARFNKYGLSLIENNNVRLRAGYEFKNDLIKNTSGNYNTELELEKQNLGFYLYNDSGQAIFKTETSSDYSGVEGDYSARLSLTGEMFITNKVLEGENNGNIISKSPELKLTGGKVITPLKIPKFYEQKIWREVLKQKSQGKEYCFPYGVFKDASGKEIVYTFPTVEDNEINKSIIIWKITSENLSEQKIEYTYDESTQTVSKEANDNKLFYGRYGYTIYTVELVDGEYESLGDNKISFSYESIKNKLNGIKGIYSTIELYVKKSQDNSNIENVYSAEGIVLNFCTKKDPTLIITAFSQLNNAPVSFYDVTDIKEKVPVKKTTENLYYYQIGVYGEIYSYWNSIEYTGNYQVAETSDVTTEEVGIFINNKTNINGGTANKLNTAISTTQESENSEEEKPEEPVVQTYADTGSSVDIFADDFILIGDSITNGLSNHSDLRENAFGVGSANTGPGWRDDFNNVPLDGKKHVAFFMGMNNIHTEEQSYKDNYKEFISHVIRNHKDTIEFLYLVSIIAVDPKSIGNYPRTNEDIEVNNSWTKNLIKEEENIIEGKPVKFIDIYEATKNISHADQVHPDDKGYKSLCEILKNAFADVVPPSVGQGTTSAQTVDPYAALAAETVLGGAERIFTIALKGHEESGDTTYKNVLTVLKNGCLYMGGTITDFYGNSLSLSGFNLLPDEIRIAKPEFILSNAGYMWMNFDKTYPIWENGEIETKTSLMDMLNSLGSSISGGGNNMSGSGLPSGYYLIDPLAD